MLFRWVRIPSEVNVAASLRQQYFQNLPLKSKSIKIINNISVIIVHYLPTPSIASVSITRYTITVFVNQVIMRLIIP